MKTEIVKFSFNDCHLKSCIDEHIFGIILTGLLIFPKSCRSQGQFNAFTSHCWEPYLRIEDYESKASITAPAYTTLRPKGAMSQKGGTLVRSIYAVLCAAGGLFIFYLFQESIA